MAKFMTLVTFFAILAFVCGAELKISEGKDLKASSTFYGPAYSWGWSGNPYWGYGYGPWGWNGWNWGYGYPYGYGGYGGHGYYYG